MYLQWGGANSASKTERAIGISLWSTSTSENWMNVILGRLLLKQLQENTGLLVQFRDNIFAILNGYVVYNSHNSETDLVGFKQFLDSFSVL